MREFTMGFDMLIVDDSGLMRALIKRTIKLSGIPVSNFYEADSGKRGLEMLAQHKVDLVLADLHMPEMSGTEMTVHILANEATRAIPVVIISAEPNEERIAALH